jgi:DNA-binding response OmpR family regulator
LTFTTYGCIFGNNKFLLKEVNRLKRILIVDDYKEIGNLLSKFFLLNGYEVDCVEDGEVALRQVTKKRYDLIITDYRMPKLDGIDLIKRLKGTELSLPILIISGSGVGEPFFRKAGADAFLTKPLDLSSMKILVEKILNSKQIVRPDNEKPD